LYGNRKNFFRVILTHHKIVERFLDFGRFNQAKRRPGFSGRLLHFAIDDRLADVDAGVADINARPGDYFFHLSLRFSAEGTERHA